jgi:hypothetical protein
LYKVWNTQERVYFTTRLCRCETDRVWKKNRGEKQIEKTIKEGIDRRLCLLPNGTGGADDGINQQREHRAEELG